MGGHSREKAGRVWYDALMRESATLQSTFKEIADLTVAAAGKYGCVDEVTLAWKTVGVL